jgi:carboxylate-amine ligase
VRTLGVEEEFLIVDPYNGAPRPLAAELLRRQDPGREPVDGIAHPTLTVELHQEQIEVITSPHSNLSGLAAEIVAGRAFADTLARSAGARIAALATSPLALVPHPTSTDRYDALLAKYALTAREQLTCGLHVHVGVDSDEEGVAILDRIRAWLPPLIALSANSPFWHGADSGYASFRTQAWNRWSTAGPTEVFGSAQAYHALITDLSGTGVVVSPDFDARLSARHPTVEIRVSDVCLDPRDTALIAALVRALAETAAREWRAGTAPDPVPAIVLRQAGWQASRWGLGGDLLHPVTHRPVPASQAIAALRNHVRAPLEEAGDDAYVEDSLQRLLDGGTGASRQRRAYERRGLLADVVTEAIAITHRLPGEDVYPEERLLATDLRAGDSQADHHRTPISL